MRDLDYHRNVSVTLPRGLVIVGLALSSWVAVACLWQVVHLVFSAILG